MEGQLPPAASATQAIYLWLSYQSSPWVRLLSHWAHLRAGDGQPQHHRGSFQDPTGESPEQPGLGSRLTLLWAWAWARALLRSLASLNYPLIQRHQTNQWVTAFLSWRQWWWQLAGPQCISLVALWNHLALLAVLLPFRGSGCDWIWGFLKNRTGGSTRDANNHGCVS